MGWFIAGGVVLVFVFIIVGMYNGLVKLRQYTRNAWSPCRWPVSTQKFQRMAEEDLDS